MTLNMTPSLVILYFGEKWYGIGSAQYTDYKNNWDILYILYHIAIIAGSELSHLKVPLAPEHNCMNICKQIH